MPIPMPLRSQAKHRSSQADAAASVAKPAAKHSTPPKWPAFPRPGAGERGNGKGARKGREYSSRGNIGILADWLNQYGKKIITRSTSERLCQAQRQDNRELGTLCGQNGAFSNLWNSVFQIYADGI